MTTFDDVIEKLPHKNQPFSFTCDDVVYSSLGFAFIVNGQHFPVTGSHYTRRIMDWFEMVAGLVEAGELSMKNETIIFKLDKKLGFVSHIDIGLLNGEEGELLTSSPYPTTKEYLTYLKSAIPIQEKFV